MPQPPAVTPPDGSVEADALRWSVAERLYAREGVAGLLEIEPIEVRESYARISATVSGLMLDGHQSARGGMIFAITASAFAYACNPRNVSTVAAQASIIFWSPAHEGEVLIAEAHEQASSGRSGPYVVQLTTEDRRPLASSDGLSRTIGGAILQFQENDVG